MAALRTLCLLLGALAALALGALAPGPAEAALSCHEAARDSGHTPEAPARPDKPLKAMDCCAACFGAIAPSPPPRGPAALPVPACEVRPTALPAGLSPAPEPHPPRTPNA